jgi:predicted acylesterase/phospholipase RssA
MTQWDRIEVGLVLQGGGALGAYEWGAIEALYAVMDELAAVRPVVLKAVTGVSIGAINGACIVGSADRADALRRLEALWRDLQLEAPFRRDLEFGWPGLSGFAPARDLSLFGLPGFYRPRPDFWNYQRWTSLYDTSPLYATLNKHIDFDAIARSDTTLVVTAVNVVDGDLKRFRNRADDGASQADEVVPFAPEHVVASGSLAPQFPWTESGGQHYWDGGIVDNTPIGDALGAFSDDDRVYRLVVVMNLFPLRIEKLPDNLLAVNERVQELRYGNRLRQDQTAAKTVNKLVRAIDALRSQLEQANIPINSDIAGVVAKAKSFKIANTVQIELRDSDSLNEDSSAARDFSPETIARRRRIGRESASKSLRAALQDDKLIAAVGQHVDA